MQFQPGKSGNPTGKKPGTVSKRTQIAKLFEPHAPALIAKCIEMALAGNEAAMRLAIERIVPRAKDVPVTFELPPGKITCESVAPIGENILRSIEQGNITPHQAKSMFEVLKGYKENILLEGLLEDYKKLSEDFRSFKNNLSSMNGSISRKEAAQ